MVLPDQGAFRARFKHPHGFLQEEHPVAKRPCPGSEGVVLPTVHQVLRLHERRQGGCEEAQGDSKERLLSPCPVQSSHQSSGSCGCLREPEEK
jgi:hypothetical protein